MTNPTLERAEQAAKREIDRLRKRRVEVAPGRFSDGLGWKNLNEVAAATTHAVLMAVREMPIATQDAIFDDRDGFVHKIDIPAVWELGIDAILNDGDAA